MHDIVRMFKRIVMVSSDIPECFIDASGYSIISSCLGRFYQIPMSGGKRPNLFIVLSSAPAIGRRSEMLKLTNIVKRSAFKTYTTLLNKNQEDKEGFKNEIRAHMLECGSEGGLIDDINYFHNQGINSFCLSSPEFGKVLKGIKDIGYMSGFDNALCRLWGGESYYQSFSHRKDGYKPRFLPSGIYFNLFSTTQKLKHYLHENMAVTGLVRRLLFSSIEGEDLKKYKPPLGRDTEQMEMDLAALGVIIGRLMYSCHKTDKLTILPLNPDAMQIINDGAEKWEKKAREDDENPYFLYQVSRWEHILKVSACDALSTLKIKIEIENVNKAIQFVDNATKDVMEILERLNISKYEKKDYDNKQKILKLIRKGADRTKIQQRMSPYGVKKRLLNKYLIELLRDEDITDEEHQKIWRE